MRAQRRAERGPEGRTQVAMASRALGVAQPTVRRQIEKLEEVLGVVLFTRSQTGLMATETAVATLPYAEAMAGAADGLVRSASAPAGADHGTVRVTCSEVVGVEVLPPMLAKLRRAHPRLQIELSLSNANMGPPRIAFARTDREGSASERPFSRESRTNVG